MRLIFLDDDEAHAFEENTEEEIVEDMMMMMMMMMVFQSKLSCDECFFFDVSTSGFLSLEKEIERGLRKNTTDTWGGKKKIEIRGTTNNNNNERGGGRVLLDRQCISYSRHKNEYVFELQKVFFKIVL